MTEYFVNVGGRRRSLRASSGHGFPVDMCGQSVKKFHGRKGGIRPFHFQR